MKKLLLGLILVSFFIFVFSIGQLYAQEKEQNIRNSNALYFYFINGYAVAYKFKNEGATAYRLQADFSAGFSDSKNNNDNNNIYSGGISDHSTSNGNGRNSNFYFNISPQLLHTLYSNNLAKIYLGYGPFAGYSRNKSTSDNVENHPDLQNDHNYNSGNTSHEYRLGLVGLAGLEGYINNVCVFADAQISCGRSWSGTDYYNKSDYIGSHNENTQSSNSKSWFINLTNIRIGIGIYF